MSGMDPPRLLDGDTELSPLFRSALEAAREEASYGRDQIVEGARATEREITARAIEESHSIVEEARDQMTTQAEMTRNKLKEEVGSLADSVAAKVLGRQI